MAWPTGVNARTALSTRAGTDAQATNHITDHNDDKTAWSELVTLLGSSPQGGSADIASRFATLLTIQEVVTAISNSGSAATVPDVTTATLHRFTLTANCTFTFPTAAAGKSFALELRQDGTGSRLATWPGTVKWPAATAPTLTTTVSKSDIFAFVCLDGTNWYGTTAGLAFA